MKKAQMPEDSKLQHVPQPSEAAKLPQLPPLSIDTMTQVELQDFIPQLVSIMMSSKPGGPHRKNGRPDWWPLHLPWTGTKTDLLYHESNWSEPLRDAIRKCYRHLGQEKLLQMNTQDSPSGATVSHPGKMGASPSYYAGPAPNNKRMCHYAEIYICYFCEREFSDKTLMREHQTLCQERPPQLQEALTVPPQSTDPGQGPPQMSPAKLSLHYKTPRVPKDSFIKLFNLVPKQKADRILARHRNSLDVECEELDYSMPETPISPTTPRTPKSLISQLSREEGPASRKRLSYSEPAGDNEDRESVVSGCSEESEEKATQKGKSLLTIDVSSLLGQRIQKHVKADSFLQVIGDSESFCKTPVKNSFYEKLRNRTITFPLSYKPRRKHDGKFVHMYGFTSRQKKEIKKRLKSGLCKKSREILRSLPKCSVDVARLTNWELKRFMSKQSYRKLMNIKPKYTVSESEFPKEPLLLSPNVDKLLGLKKRSEFNKTQLNRLAPVNVVSEDANAEITRQKLTLYRCLLSDLAAMQSSMTKNKTTQALQKSLKLKLNQRPAVESHDSVSVKKEKPEISGIQASTPLLNPPLHDTKLKRKRSLNQSVDDISIISISSDEESVNSRCCVACRKKKQFSPVLPLPLPNSRPLSVSPSSSVSVTPQVSPCSCISSPESEASLHLRLSPVSDLVQWHVKSPTSQATKSRTSVKPSLKAAMETPVSSAVFQKTKSREVSPLKRQDSPVPSRSPARKPLTDTSMSKLRTSPRKSQQSPSVSVEVKVQGHSKEKDKNLEKKETSIENLRLGPKATASPKTSPQKSSQGKQMTPQKTSPKKSSSVKKTEFQQDLTEIQTRSRSGIPPKRSKRIMSLSSLSPQSSPKKPRIDSK
uniref:Uncharacterized protein LOC111107589 isoform X2 n=1 Tax=Crassostrea virginica TaxID=6565 RepID=A0A8B8B5Y6_CRAVI|nr:uncharacterized protein LOC111107589 isoform X2 [Crassostrea virginica]